MMQVYRFYPICTIYPVGEAIGLPRNPVCTMYPVGANIVRPQRDRSLR